MYIERGKKNITEEGLERSSAVLMPAGSILYSSRAPIGYVVISKNPISTNQGFKSLVPAVSGMSEFYYFVLKARTADIKQRATGTTFKEISGYDFGDTFVPLPPLSEQQRIVEQIETLLGYVDIIDTDAETLEKSITLAKQKILDLAIRGKLVPQDPIDEPASELLKKIKAEKDALVKAGKLKKDKHESFIFKSDDNCYHENIDGKVTDITDEIPFDLPEGWHWFRLKNLCSLITDGTHQTPEYSETGYVFLSSTNVTSGKIDWKNVKYIPEKLHTMLHDRLAPQFGDILLAKNGTIGCAAIVDRVDVFDIYVSLALLRPFRTAIMSEYLHKIIGASAVQNYFAGEKKGIGLYNLHLENIRQTPIPLPPLAEQKRIVSQVEKLFSVLETMRG